MADIPESDTAIAKRTADPLYALIGSAKSRIAAVVPKHVTVERLLRLMYTECSRVPHLRDCSPESLIMGLIGASQLGLEIGGPQGLAYLIPFKGQAQLIIGYKGWLSLAQRSGQIRRIHAEAVYQEEVDRDLFAVDLAAGRVRHEWRPEIQRTSAREGSTVVAAYCMVELVGGATDVVVLSVSQIEDRRKRGGSGRGSKTPWDTDYPAMARKTAIRAMLTGGTIPLSVEMSTALEIDEPDVIDVAPSAPEPRRIAPAVGGMDALDAALAERERVDVGGAA